VFIELLYFPFFQTNSTYGMILHPNLLKHEKLVSSTTSCGAA
jgi:hypothetical protein